MGQLNRTIAGLIVGGSLLAGCGEPPLSAAVDDGGNVASPTGVIEGTVTYLGPRPLCEFGSVEVEGKKVRAPTKLRGAGAVLVLYDFDAPPPPNGPPPSSALVVPVSEFFGDFSDCMPEDATPDDLALLVTRTASFTWPNVPIGEGITPRSYRIEGVFDRDGDYYPLFLTHNIPTAGDVLGAATKSFTSVCSPTDTSGCYEVRFDGECDHTVGDSDRLDGQFVRGVNVTLGLPIWTERPFFEPKQTGKGFMSSEQTFDVLKLALPQVDPDGPDAARRKAYEAMQSWGGLTLSLVDEEHASPKCDEKDLPEGEVCVGNRLKKLGLDYDLTDPRVYSWNLWPYDADHDGELECEIGSTDDCHPMSFVFGGRDGTSTDGFIFSEPTQWTFPQIFLARVQSQEEKLSAIPTVGLLGGVDAYQQRKATVFKKDLAVTVLPTATMDLVPGDDSCDVDIVPPGNPAPGLENSRNVVDCQELPIGDYSFVVLGGLAGGLEYVEDPKSETGWNVAKTEGGFLPLVAGPGQLWLLPNDLGEPSKFASAFEGTEAEKLKQANDVLIPSQSIASAFKIRDPNPSSKPEEVRPFIKDSAQIVQADDSPDGQCRLRSDCADALWPGQDGPDADNLPDNNFQGLLKEVEYRPLPDRCCSAHTVSLCDVKLCEPDEEEPGKRSPVKLKAWVVEGDVDASTLTQKELDKITPVDLSLAEAAAKQEKGATVVFAGRYRLAGADEAPDLIRTSDEEVTGEISLFVSYDELMNPPKEATESGSPDCDALRNPPKGSKDDAVATKGTVRLKRVALTPSCIPFLMPAQCCGVEEPASLNDGDYGACE